MVAARPARALLLGLLLCAGCAGTVESVFVARRRGEGTRVSYSGDLDQLWRAARAALNWSSISVLEDHRSEGYFLGWFAAPNLRPSSYVGVWFEPGTGAGTTVTVVSRAQMAFQKADVSEEEVHRDLARAMYYLEQKKGIPLVRPE
jgi:hypothetical protein